MKIFLLSDIESLNKGLEIKIKEEIEMFGNKIAYISSSAQDETLPWFHNLAREYKNINPKIELTYFDLSKKFTSKELETVSDFNIIHLSGGNTFDFLASIRKRNFQTVISKFCKDKLIIGTSAGAILLTPSIKIASLEDENSIGMIDFRALNFVNFEFFPHFDNTSEKSLLIEEYSRNNNSTVYATTDHDGIFVENGRVSLFGDIKTYSKPS